MLLHVCVILRVVAQAGAQADSLDNYIAAEMAKQHIPSLALAVVQNGNVVKMKAYGLANLELNVPAAPNSVYQLQSITKSFVACAIMPLVEDRKLGLDDKITKYLSGLPRAWSDITVRQLLTHTSGIPGFIQDQGGWQPMVAFGQTVSKSEEIVAWAAARPLKFAPGEGRSYSGTGYHLAGMIIEKVTGKPRGQYLNERIFAPWDDQHSRRQLSGRHSQSDVWLRSLWRCSGQWVRLYAALHGIGGGRSRIHSGGYGQVGDRAGKRHDSRGRSTRPNGGAREVEE